MERFKFLGMIGSVCLGAAASFLAPDTAQAGCCPSNWSTTNYNGGDSSQCDVIVGGGRVDGLNRVAKPFAVSEREDVITKIEDAPGAYSPAIRTELECAGQGFPMTTGWLALTPGGDPWTWTCFGGVLFSRCQTRLADDTYCTGSCG
jgi:hypothetical protein